MNAGAKSTAGNIRIVLTGLPDKTPIKWCGRKVTVGEVRQAIKGLPDNRVVYTERLFPIKEVLVLV